MNKYSGAKYVALDQTDIGENTVWIFPFIVKDEHILERTFEQSLYL